MAQAMPLSETCHFDVGGTTKVFTTSGAIEWRDKHGSFKGACIHCGETVFVHRASKNAGAHFEHMEGNTSCPLSAPHR